MDGRHEAARTAGTGPRDEPDHRLFRRYTMKTCYLSGLLLRSHFGVPTSARQMYKAGSRRFERTPYRARM